MVMKWLPASTPTLLGELHAAIGQQYFRLTYATGMQDDLAWRRVTGGVFVTETEVKITQRDPACLAAPPDVDDAFTVGQQAAEFGDSLRGRRLETGAEGVAASDNPEICHRTVW